MEKRTKSKKNRKLISESSTRIKIKETENNDTTVEEISEVVATNRKERIINKRPLDEDSKLGEVLPQLEKKKQKFKKPNNKVLNKKIIFKDNDEEPCEPFDEDSKHDEVVPQLEKKKQKFKKPKNKVLNKKIILKDNDEEPCEPFDEDSKHDEVVPQLEKKKQKFKKSQNKVLNKKIIFKDNDEEPCEVTNIIEPETKNKAKPLNEDEAEVKEEDIDKFCDEISEKDNEQYEDWVKLIEAKLHSNKKLK